MNYKRLTVAVLLWIFVGFLASDPFNLFKESSMGLGIFQIYTACLIGLMSIVLFLLSFEEK